MYYPEKVHMKEIEKLIPKYGNIIVKSVDSDNECIAGDALSLITQYLITGQTDLVTIMMNQSRSLHNAIHSKR